MNNFLITNSTNFLDEHDYVEQFGEALVDLFDQLVQTKT